MRILSVVRHSYYGNRRATEPFFLHFTAPLRQMGHEVATFDHYEAARNFGKSAATHSLVERILRGAFDVTLYQTSGREPIETRALRDLSRRFCVIAWNSDDDWQWESATSRIAADFTYMVTTYRSVYESSGATHPNLLLSQWGCYDGLARFACSKDLALTFVGQLYRTRVRQCRYLSRTVGLKAFGGGARLLKLGLPYFRGARYIPWLCGNPLTFERVHDVWNRSRISFTPMESSGRSGATLQLKGRAFEMGLSGTLMLTNQNPALENYYVPGREFVPFYDLNDCADKAKFYLAHEGERARIAEAYRDRTLAEHLWRHRFERLFHQIGL